MFSKNFLTANQVPVNTESISTCRSQVRNYSHGMKESIPIISHFLNKCYNALCKTKSLRIKGFKPLTSIPWYKTTAL